MKERQHATDLLAGYVVAPLEELFDIEHVDEAAGAGRDNDDGFLWMVNNTHTHTHTHTLHGDVSPWR